MPRHMGGEINGSRISLGQLKINEVSKPCRTLVVKQITRAGVALAWHLVLRIGVLFFSVFEFPLIQCISECPVI